VKVHHLNWGTMYGELVCHVLLVEHNPDGEKWRGFAAAKELDEMSPGVALISLPGHTRGHACLAVDAGHRWVLHCGDPSFTTAWSTEPHLCHVRSPHSSGWSHSIGR
jgi:glyoxylase-like metal-dependent hydrolase (beta-lactamase superfamily II)